MSNQNFQDRLVKEIAKRLSIKPKEIKLPPQGMTSKVFFIKAEDAQEYAVKYGSEAMNDVPAFELIAKQGIGISVPKMYLAFEFENVPVVVMERVVYPLLDSIPVPEMGRYIPSMVTELRKLHEVKSDKPGLLIEPNSNKSWPEMMLDIFNGETFDWQEVASREGVNKELILSSVEKMIDKINNTDFPTAPYSLLHTDFNQRNLFVDPSSDRITGVIDWEEAMFGDPIYDFARIRMYIWHFDLGEQVVEDYYKLMDYTPEQKKLEDLYWLSRVTQYLGWYSEELNEFNRGRIKLHQDFLKDYDWKD